MKIRSEKRVSERERERKNLFKLSVISKVKMVKALLNVIHVPYFFLTPFTASFIPTA